MSASELPQQRLPEYRREQDWIRGFLIQGEIGRVATADADQPYITPTTYWYDEVNHQIIVHSSLAGHLRTNIERNPQVCFEVSRVGRFLPAGTAQEFSVQYASVIVFGRAHILDSADQKRRGLAGLLDKYFPDLRPGEDYRQITESELASTSVYAISIERWTGKENWPE
jgi:uncharacterized protein